MLITFNREISSFETASCLQVSFRDAVLLFGMAIPYFLRRALMKPFFYSVPHQSTATFPVLRYVDRSHSCTSDEWAVKQFHTR